MSKTDILYLYDSEQVPFGKLSPLYRKKLNVMGVDTSNVISYCYAGLLKEGGVKNYILNESGKEARDQSLRYFREERDQIYNNALENALLERVKQDPIAKQQLIDSQNSIIIYQSTDVYLGVNERGEGQNKVGNILMNIRNSIIKEDIEEQKITREKNIERLRYNINIVYKTLEDRIKKGIDDLHSYIGKDANEIIEMLQLPRFPGQFKGSLEYNVAEYIMNSNKLAEDLRKIHAEEYNESVLRLAKKDTLYSYLINQALKSLPADYDQLYKRWNQVRNIYSEQNKEEYKNLSEKIKPVIRDINNFLRDLNRKNALCELEDRIYLLASKGLIPGLVVDVPILLPVEEITEKDYKKYLDSTKTIIEDLKRFRDEKDSFDQKQKEDYKKMIEKNIQRYKDDQKHLARLEHYYLSKALQEVDEKEEILSEEQIRELDSFIKIQQYYQEKYPKIFDKISKVSLRIKDEILLQKLLDEYREDMPKTSLYWKDGVLTRRSFPGEVVDDLHFARYFARGTTKTAFPIFAVEKYRELTAKKPAMKKSEITKIISNMWRKEMTDQDKKIYEEKADEFNRTIAQDYIKDIKDIVKSPKIDVYEQDEKLPPSFFRFGDESPLSPSYVSMITIKKLLFPNPYYYIYFMLILSVIDVILKENGEKLNSISTSHNLIMISPDMPSRDLTNFKPFNQVYELYRNMENQYVEITLKNRAVKVLYTKFDLEKNPQMAKLLIVSNPKTLVYNDKNDLYLGSGPIIRDIYQGKNIIGKVMTVIRQELTTQYAKKYKTPLVIEDIRDISEEHDIREHLDFEKKDTELTEFSYDKMKEFLFVFMLYVTYIKQSKSIELDDVKFVMEVLYSKLYNKGFETIKIPRVNDEFQKQSDDVLSKYNYTISREALTKLWSYIYIINKLMVLDLVDKNLDLFGLTKIDMISQPISYENISQYIANIDYESRDWFFETVKESLKKNEKVCVSIGLTYRRDDKDEKATHVSKTVCRTVDKTANDKTLEKVYLSLTMELMNKIKDNFFYKDSIINIYVPTVSLLRKNYVSEGVKKCSETTDNQVHNCVLDAYVNVIGNLRKKNITEITPNVLNFATLLLSTSGNFSYFRNPDIINIIKKQRFTSDDSKDDSSIQKFLVNKLSMPIVEKLMGKYTKKDIRVDDGKYDEEHNTTINLYIPDINFKNREDFQLMLNVKITGSNYEYNKKYNIKGDSTTIDNVDESGDVNIQQITFGISGGMLYLTIDKRTVESIDITYKMVSKVKNISILQKIISLSSSLDRLSRVISFLPSPKSNVFDDIENQLEQEEVERLRKGKKKKRQEDEEGDEEGEEEVEGVSEEEAEVYMQYEGEGEDEEEDEGEEEYYE